MSAQDESTNQPAVKDEAAAHPVASEWRPALREVVKALAEANYSLNGGINSVAPVSQALADRMKGYVANYGESLIEIPDATWDTSVAQWMGTHWDVLVDLWTRESGQSDLVLSVRVFDVDGGGYRLELDSLHVP